MTELSDRFAGAVRTLVADGPIKQRLLAAYEQFVSALDSGDLPAAQRRALDELHGALAAANPASGESAARASVRKMSPADAERHARSMLDLFVALLEHGERAEPLKVVHPASPAAPAVPRYVARRG